jgi:hypothetical protein
MGECGGYLTLKITLGRPLSKVPGSSDVPTAPYSAVAFFLHIPSSSSTECANNRVRFNPLKFVRLTLQAHVGKGCTVFLALGTLSRGRRQDG